MNEPIFVTADPAQILAQVLDSYEQLTGYKLNPADAEYSICSSIAYQKALTLQRVNETGKSQLLDYATGVVLDYIAAPFDIQRLPAEQSSCTLRFEIIDGHLEVLLPLGTRVASVDGNAIFQTIDDVTILEGVSQVEVSAICQTAGVLGNGYAVSTITELLDPYAYVTSVQNIDITAGGSDEETDENLRERVKLSASKFSVAGPTYSYIYWAKSASPLISDVSIDVFDNYMPITTYTAWTNNMSVTKGQIISYNGTFYAALTTHTSTTAPYLDHVNFLAAGDVFVYALMTDGNIPTQSINDGILAILNGDKIRPINDTVYVKSPTAREYEVTLNVTKYEDVNSTLLTPLIYDLVDTLLKEKRQLLGKDIIATEVEKVARIDGVYDVECVITPNTGSLTGRNLIITPSEVAKYKGIQVNIIGTNNG